MLSFGFVLGVTYKTGGGKALMPKVRKAGGASDSTGSSLRPTLPLFSS